MVNVDGSGVFHFDDGFGLSIVLTPVKLFLETLERLSPQLYAQTVST